MKHLKRNTTAFATNSLHVASYACCFCHEHKPKFLSYVPLQERTLRTPVYWDTNYRTVYFVPLPAGLSPWRHQFDPKLTGVGFVVDKVRYDYILITNFCALIIIYS